MLRAIGYLFPLVLAGLLLINHEAAADPPMPEQTDLMPQAVSGPVLFYQGRLADPVTGNPKPDGNYNMVFQLYNVASGGSSLWSEAKLVAVTQGLFSTLLGDKVPLNPNHFNGQDLWLGVTVGADPEATPRQMVTYVAYTFYARNADTVDGQHASAFAAAGHNHDATYWRLTGNSNTTPSNFLGTTNSVQLTLRVSNTVALRLEPTTHTPNLIGGYEGNSATAGVVGATIGGGGSSFVCAPGQPCAHRVTDVYGTIAGGYYNQAGDSIGTAFDAPAATVGGGAHNRASGGYATVGGGSDNLAAGAHAAIGGGLNNMAMGGVATIAGGEFNTAIGWRSTIAGGYAVTATGYAAAVGGGDNNLASGYASVVSGGAMNTASGDYANVGGGVGHVVTGTYATIGGGGGNLAGGTSATISGGYNNRTSSDDATIGGGYLNTASGYRSTIGGGIGNVTSGYASTVSGGSYNTASGMTAVVGGGGANVASGYAAVIAGGGSYGWGTYLTNTASGDWSVIDGGYLNSASGFRSVISGGSSNRAAGDSSTIGGGVGNVVSGTSATVGGGWNNSASGGDSTIGGGIGNVASGPRSTISGGYYNVASENAATVAGGANNTAGGAYSFAAGAGAQANHIGAFVWSSGNNTESWGNQTFTARAPGGVRFYSAGDTRTGVQLSAGSSSWGSISDRESKENFAPVDDERLLAALATMPMQTWNLKSQPDEVRHIGPVAQDFNSAFADLFGEVESPVHINTMDAVGVSLAAAQALYQRNQEQAARIRQLEAQNAAQQQVIDDLQRRMAALEARGTPGGSNGGSIPWLPGAGLGLAGLIWLTRRGGGR